MPTVVTSLTSYLDAVESRVRAVLVDAPLHPQQIALLVPLACDDRWTDAPLRHALAPLYLLVRARGGRVDAAAVGLGAGLLLAQRCMCLIDDVEDSELAGAVANAGPVLAINAGLTLFLLAVAELSRAQVLLPTTLDRDPFWRPMLAHSLRLSRAQHEDIGGRARPRTLADAARLATDKSALCCIFAECAMACADGPDADAMASARRIGDALACLQQTVDDISDLFAPEPSADLRTGTCNVPYAALLECLPQEQRAPWLDRLARPEPGMQRELGEALYASGAMRGVAELLESQRCVLHDELAIVGRDPVYRALLLAWTDDLCALVYRPTRGATGIDIEDVDPAGLEAGDRDLFDRLLFACRRTRDRAAVGA